MVKKTASIIAAIFIFIAAGMILITSDIAILPASATVIHENTTVWYNDTNTYIYEDTIIRNCTVYIYGNIWIYNANLTIENSTLYFNPAANNYYYIRHYDTLHKYPIYFNLTNSTILTNNSYTYGGIWAEGQYNNLNIHNTYMNSYYQIETRDINTIDINNFTSGPTGYRRFVIDHSTYNKAIFGHGNINNSNFQYMTLYLNTASEKLTIQNTTISGTIYMGDWGTIEGKNLTFGAIAQAKGTTELYHAVHVYVYDMNGTPIKADITVIDDMDNRTYTIDKYGVVYPHTFTIGDGTTIEYHNVLIGINGTLYRILPQYSVGWLNAYIYYDPTTGNISMNTTAICCTLNGTGNNTTNGTGAVSIPEAPINPYMIIYGMLAMNLITFIIVIGLLIIGLHVIRKRRKGGV